MFSARNKLRALVPLLTAPRVGALTTRENKPHLPGVSIVEAPLRHSDAEQSAGRRHCDQFALHADT